MSKRMENLSVKLEPEVRAEIEAEAERDRRRPSAVARNILEDWYEARRVQASERAARA